MVASHTRSSPLPCATAAGAVAFAMTVDNQTPLHSGPNSWGILLRAWRRRRMAPYALFNCT
eukprot:2902630-Amphidinium_carterae.1